DFQHLSDVLEEFADTMAFRRGGLEAVNKAIECQRTATCEYSSGLQVTGVFTEVLTSNTDAPVYLKTTGPTALAFADKQLTGHDKNRHAEGFDAPVGRWRRPTRSPATIGNSRL